MNKSQKHVVKRAAQTAALTVGGGIALTFALAGSAHADVVDQDANVVNTGVGVANSGGNVAVGNNSTNTAATGQAAVAPGGIASNVANTSNESNGSASIETGDANAAGNVSDTDIDQQADQGSDPGLDVTVQHSGVVNAGVGVANTGGNIGVGNNSTNTAVTGQHAVGFLASNVADTSNSSDGSVYIKTGDANAVGNDSKTKVKQHAKESGPGLAVVVQDSDVLNFGIGLANTGGNIGVGNNSTNTAVTLQGAFGFLASNIASTKNSSNGSVGIVTGNANAMGNHSSTDIEQDADVDDPGLAVVVQNAPVVNAGIGIANSGGNIAAGNVSNNQAFVAQVSFGFLASNIADTENWSDGFVMVISGDATGVGNDSTTTVKQYA